MVEYGTGFLWISAELVPIPLCINLFFCVNVLLYLLLTVVLFTLSQVLTDISAQTSVNDPMGEYSSKNIHIFFYRNPQMFRCKYRNYFRNFYCRPPSQGPQDGSNSQTTTQNSNGQNNQQSQQQSQSQGV